MDSSLFSAVVDHAPLLILCLCTGSILFCLLAAVSSVRRPGLRQLPGPKLAAITRLWNLKNVIGGNAPENFRKLHERYGRIVRTGPNHVSISDPAAIPEIYGILSNYAKSDFYTAFDTPYDGLAMASMFSTRSAAEHKHLKTAVASKFSMTSLRDMEPMVDECSDMFLDAMRDLSGAPIDLGAWLQWYAFDVIGAITFRQCFGFMEERKDVQDMISGIETGLWYGSLVGQIPEFHPWLLGNPLLMKLMESIPALQEVHPVPKMIRVTKNAMKRYDNEERVGNDRGDFLALFRKEQTKNVDRMSERDIINHLINNLLAGSDTTAISLRAILYYIIKTPRVHQKMVEELEDAERKGEISDKITFEECNKLSYLQAVIKEAMRMHPGVGFPLERVVPPRGAKLCDVDLPGGTIVGVNAWVIHQNQGIYGHDAEIFRPERWIESPPEQLKLMDRYFLSFGHGARTCIGKNISIMEMGKLVPRILRAFDLEWAAEADEWTVKTFWFAKQTDLFVRFKSKMPAKAE